MAGVSNRVSLWRRNARRVTAAGLAGVMLLVPVPGGARAAETGRCSGGCSAAPAARHPQVPERPVADRPTPARRLPDLPAVDRVPLARDITGPHGGRVVSGRSYSFEVVYMPQETRVFVYSLPGRQLDVRTVRGVAVMEVRDNRQPYRYPIRAAADRAGHTYLSLPVDVSGVRDGDMRVTFDLTGLPLPGEPQARFTQVFALSRMKPPVAAHDARPAVQIVRFTEADRPLMERQGICPVMKSPLGEHGQPIKLVVYGRPVFVCCKGCVRKVQKNPTKYLAMIAQGPARSAGYAR